LGRARGKPAVLFQLSDARERGETMGSARPKKKVVGLKTVTRGSWEEEQPIHAASNRQQSMKQTRRKKTVFWGGGGENTIHTGENCKG